MSTLPGRTLPGRTLPGRTGPGRTGPGRTLAISALATAIPLAPAEPGAVIDGQPSAGFVALDARDGTEIGLWEMTSGVSRDVESDEWFVVVAGRATVAFDDGRPSIELAAASVVRLDAGDRTIWTVHETLRKVYVTPAD